MERSTNLTLFERLRGRLIPTPDARSLYRQVHRSFVGLDDLSRFITELRELRQGRLVIGCYPAPSLAAVGVRWSSRVDSGFAAAVCALVGEGLGVALVDAVSASDHRHLAVVVSRPFRPRVAMST